MVKKDTTLLINVPLEELECRCPGNHPHEVLKGSTLFDGRWVSRSALAGTYPPRLHRRWGEAVTQSLRHVCGGMGSEPHLLAN